MSRGKGTHLVETNRAAAIRILQRAVQRQSISTKGAMAYEDCHEQLNSVKIEGCSEGISVRWGSRGQHSRDQSPLIKALSAVARQPCHTNALLHGTHAAHAQRYDQICRYRRT
jgi:hypothetical protein